MKHLSNLIFFFIGLILISSDNRRHEKQREQRTYH